MEMKPISCLKPGGAETESNAGFQQEPNRKRSRMQKQLSSLILILAALGVAAPQASDAQNQPSAKVTAKTANLTLLPQTSGTGVWQTVLANNIKTANQKDLFITASFEIGLYTDTLVTSKLMQKDTSVANSSVQVQVLLDGNPVEPGTVVYGRRIQTLSATLEGAIASCLTLTTNLDGTGSIVLDTNCVAPETIELALDTLDAASFSFVAVDVPQGVHTIAVQARIETGGSAQTGSFAATGMVGKGSMTVESVRLIKDPNVILDVE